MENKILQAVYNMVDEYSLGAAEEVSESEREPVASYFFQFVRRLLNDEGIDPATQDALAAKAGVSPSRIDEIATFLNQWGTDPEEDEEE